MESQPSPHGASEFFDKPGVGSGVFKFAVKVGVCLLEILEPDTQFFSFAPALIEGLQSRKEMTEILRHSGCFGSTRGLEESFASNVSSAPGGLIPPSQLDKVRIPDQKNT